MNVDDTLEFRSDDTDDSTEAQVLESTTYNICSSQNDSGHASNTFDNSGQFVRNNKNKCYYFILTMQLHVQ